MNFPLDSQRLIDLLTVRGRMKGREIAVASTGRRDFSFKDDKFLLHGRQYVCIL